MAALARSGLSRARIEEVAGVPIPLDLPLEGRRLEVHLNHLANLQEFQERRRARTRFRRFWWRRLLYLTAASLVLASWLTTAALGSLFEGMSLQLPWPTRCLLTGHGVWPLLLFLVARYWPELDITEERLEREAHHCWALKSALSAGIPYHEAAVAKVSPALSSLLEHSRRRGGVCSVLSRWAAGLEWDLHWRSRRRGGVIWLLPLLGGGVIAWTLVGWFARFTQLIGCL